MEPSEAEMLKSLLQQRPVGALATLHKGEPAISMVPFAFMPDSATFVIHVSRLATHTNDMLAHPAVALLITARCGDAESPLALPRVSVQGLAARCERDSADYRKARDVYLARLPEAADLFSFGDFSLFLIATRTVRFVAGFGRAMSIKAEDLAAQLKGETQ
ncbi:MAG TPA: pyridoxamine 5'-phosphate oxidase family protein [Rhodocyclaceae bacterium]|nr:pyridoxamine 5'-phosphate oxidase family protein [Rhodocyclaceae bacterium]